MKPRQQLAIDLGNRISGSVVGTDFGHGCLMVDNKIFAFTRTDESAALKLPEARIAELKQLGLRMIDEAPRPGAHHMRIAFVHPKSTFGVLTELCEPASETR